MRSKAKPFSSAARWRSRSTPACAGVFAAGGVSHHIENRGTAAFTYLEIGDRTAGDLVEYPFDDLVAIRRENQWA